MAVISRGSVRARSLNEGVVGLPPEHVVSNSSA